MALGDYQDGHSSNKGQLVGNKHQRNDIALNDELLNAIPEQEEQTNGTSVNGIMESPDQLK